jgi:two-component system chemotaxis sensor kinase CheA
VVELHGLAARMRMIPAAQLFQRLPRLVRDLSHQLGKPVRLVLAGEENEADRDLLEALFEPLVHLVRNSLDHGVEPPEERQRLGKPATATLTLRARTEADGLVVELADDGGGIDPAVLRRRAVAQGLLSPDEAAALDDAQALELVFTSRLSTAIAVSAISGRGVGMAAVRQAVTELGGSVGLASHAGQGTLVWLRVPMRVSLSRIVLVRLGSQWFGLTLDAVVETIRLPRAQIQSVRHGQAAILGDRLVPLLDIRRKLALMQTAPQTTAAATAQLVVLAGGAGETAIEVDAIGERQEAILRPLAGLLAATPFVLGTTLLGNGTVLLVLDVRALLA